MSDTKYKKLPKESHTQFATRVVIKENRPMHPTDVLSVSDLRSWKARAGNVPTKEQVQAYLCDAVKKGLLCKWKSAMTTPSRMVYAACKLMPSWATAKPIPAYSKKTGYSRDAPTAPVDLREAIREAKEKSDKLAQAGYERIAELNIERRTPIIKPSGMSSNILDVLSVYHGKTVEQIEDIIMSKIRTARVDNKTLKRVSLFSVLKEMVE